MRGGFPLQLGTVDPAVDDGRAGRGVWTDTISDAYVIREGNVLARLVFRSSKESMTQVV